MRRVLWIAVVLAVTAAVIGLSWYYLADLSPPREGFLVEDPNGDRLEIRVDPSRQEAIDALMEMHVTGESKWVGGEIESFENEFGFRFKPNTIVVADLTAEGAQAVFYRTIQDDFAYWQAFGAVYVEGNVVFTPP
ncbi:MAG: hypothetical protein ACE5LS_05510 [Thermoplasmata archaeon]